jgi:type I restriction enzyme S subunit
MAAVGELGLVAISSEDVVLNQQLHAFVCSNLVYNEYLGYWLASQKPYMESVASKTTILYLNKTNCESIPVALPPLPEQRKIAKILSTWDKAISTTERLIDNSKQQKKTLMQQLLTGKKRLLDGSGKLFEGEWEETKLSNIADIVMGSSPKSSSYNEISEGLPLLQGNADIKNRKSAPRIYTSEVTKKCGIDDILLSVRAPVGTIAKSIHEACIGRGISAIKAKKENSQSYVYQFLLWFEPRWEKYSQGSTFEAVNSNDIKSLHLLIPSFLEQQKIASVLTNADLEIELLVQQLADLKQEKKALMQQLLTGKRRVIV